MLSTLTHLFLPHSSNNYKAKTLHISSLSTLMILVMLSQILITIFSRVVPNVLGIATSITAEELINLTNSKRSEQGLPVLTYNPVLAQAAQAKGADMVAKGYWAHTSPDGLTPWTFFKQASYKYLYAGENLARDFGNSSAVVNAWMNSATHRENIMSNRYREMGIAVIHDTFQGQPTTLVVQMFGTQVSSVSITEAAEAVLAEMEAPQVPVIDSFSLTKSVSISLTLVLLTVMIIDTVIIARKRIVRLSGKGWAHLVFLGILLLILIGIQPGLIL
ncbi:MAG: CAP domain-containing protein [Patescibacteria group bacterium]|nr:CAP domain-containing protein [Patescibacteria group bacterium]MDP4031172.1 CAP domain-containing protein [Candidatus Beckwithbacteria bacterium]MDZ4228897.1 CAP domain-containing protein [Patescibacteria group bacterium]